MFCNVIVPASVLTPIGISLVEYSAGKSEFSSVADGAAAANLTVMILGGSTVVGALRFHVTDCSG